MISSINEIFRKTCGKTYLIICQSYWGLRSKRTENLCKAVSRNLSRRLALLRRTSATGKAPSPLWVWPRSRNLGVVQLSRSHWAG